MDSRFRGNDGGGECEIFGFKENKLSLKITIKNLTSNITATSFIQSSQLRHSRESGNPF